jgi:hypothetical protein
MKRVTIAIVAVVAVAAVVVLGLLLYSTTWPVDVSGTITLKGYTLVPTYPTNMTWTNTYDQRVYVADIWNIHGNTGNSTCNYMVWEVPPGDYSVRVYIEGQVPRGSYFTRNVTVPSTTRGYGFSMNIEYEFLVYGQG